MSGTGWYAPFTQTSIGNVAFPDATCADMGGRITFARRSPSAGAAARAVGFPVGDVGLKSQYVALAPSASADGFGDATRGPRSIGSSGCGFLPPQRKASKGFSSLPPGDAELGVRSMRAGAPHAPHRPASRGVPPFEPRHGVDGADARSVVAQAQGTCRSPGFAGPLAAASASRMAWRSLASRRWASSRRTLAMISAPAPTRR